MRSLLVTIFAAALAAALTTGAAAIAPAPPAVAATAATCRRVAVPVALVAGAPADRTVRGTYCTPRGARSRTDVDVLLAGATYDRRYWDWPTDRSRHSFVRRTTAAGRATLALDRIGSGTSSYPAGTRLTMAADAFAVHQVLRWVRAHHRVRKLTLVGHSLGSAVAVTEAATYHDVDRLVLTGMLHSRGSGLARAQAAFIPATAPGSVEGYLTTRPGARADLFFSAGARPSVIAGDEARKGVVAVTEFGDYGTMLAPPEANPSARVSVPVLLVAGRQDVLLCGGSLDCTDPAAVRANELRYFPRSPSVTAVTIPRTGHALALHPSAPVTFARIDAWIRTH